MTQEFENRYAQAANYVRTRSHIIDGSIDTAFGEGIQAELVSRGAMKLSTTGIYNNHFAPIKVFVPVREKVYAERYIEMAREFVSMEEFKQREATTNA